MPLPAEVVATLRAEFTQQAQKQFDEFFDPERQSLYITLTQHEDFVLAMGRKMASWLLQQHLAQHEVGEEGGKPTRPCPSCRRVCLPDKKTSSPVPRLVKTRAGELEIQRLKYYCPGCRRAFFPL
jgi:hypothetical protein